MIEIGPNLAALLKMSGSTAAMLAALWILFR